MSASANIPSTLARINAETRERVRRARVSADLRSLERAAAEHSPRGFRANLARVGASGPAVIAELKKASPSKGLIREDFQVEPLARQLQRAGATALSVLTEEQHFQGSLQNLERASAATTLPCLRKDFILDEFQILEARAHCADAILLIVASLTDSELRELNGCAREYGLDVLCEVHDEAELVRALDCGFETIGVNNRNLHTFEVSLETSVRLASLMPAEILKVAESGIHNSADMGRLRAAGFTAFLIGESLMRQPQPGDALRTLLEGA